MTSLGTVKPLLFDQSLIISLSKDWLTNFSTIPEFDVIIDKKGRLCIISQEEMQYNKLRQKSTDQFCSRRRDES